MEKNFKLKKQLRKNLLTKKVNKVLELINFIKTYPLQEQKIKERKHTPLAISYDNISFDEYKISMIHEGCTKIYNLINECEMSKSYSISDYDFKWHKNYIIKQLDCLKNEMTICDLDIIDKFSNNETKSYNMCLQGKKYIDILKDVTNETKYKRSNGENMYRKAYLINIFPPLSFVSNIENNKTLIATSYVLARGHNNVINIFFDNYSEWNMLHRCNNLYDKIKDFNRNRSYRPKLKQIIDICENTGRIMNNIVCITNETKTIIDKIDEKIKIIPLVKKEINFYNKIK